MPARPGYSGPMDGFLDDQGCFVCGRMNPGGLQVAFQPCVPGLGAEGEVTFPAHLQGWKGTVHGGMLATILDEAMIKAASAAGIKCATGELNVRFKRPAATGVPYRVTGRVVEVHGRVVKAEGVLRDAAGQVHAEASGKLVKIP